MSRLGDVERVTNVDGVAVYVHRLIGSGPANSPIPFMAVAQTMDGKLSIVANDSMLQLRKNLFRAAVAHEAGHIVLRHPEKHVELGDYRCIEEEVAADKYSASVVGPQHVVALLEAVLSSAKKHALYDVELLAEFETRIAIVRSFWL